MPLEMPKLFLARHGDTAWTDFRQRTGRTDNPTSGAGAERARQLGVRLRRFSFARVLTSPLQRAPKAHKLAGFGAVAAVDPDVIRRCDVGRPCRPSEDFAIPICWENGTQVIELLHEHHRHWKASQEPL